MSVSERVERILSLVSAEPAGVRDALRAELEQMLSEERHRSARPSVVAMSEEDAVRYRAISELASDYVYALRIDGDSKPSFEWISGSFEQLTGYSPLQLEEAGGLAVLLHPEERAKLLDQGELATLMEPKTLEYRICTQHGYELWLRDYACPELDASGTRVVRIFGAVKDVTQEKQAQTALREAKRRLEQRVGLEEARFRAVLDQAGEAIFMVDPSDGSFTDVNETACRMLGFARGELLGMNARDIEAEEPKWLAPDQLKELRSRNLSMESLHRRRDGSTFSVEIAVSLHRYAGRDYLLAIAREITERKQLEVQLAQADRLASVGVLAAGVAHEVNNPLVYILNNISYVLTELPPQLGELREALREARSGAERVRDIVQDLKTFARSEERLGPVDVREVLEVSIRLASAEIRFRASLELEYDEDVPPVRANGRLGQVFLNLLTNAAHSITEGRPALNRIHVAVHSREGRVAVVVSDTGCGIAPDKLAKVFDPFYTTKPIGEGTGLGLSICRNITRSLGGDIEVESEFGKGSRFTVWLPVMAGAAERGDMSSSLPPPEPARALHVLVVDDDPFVARAVSRLLRSQHSVSVACSGAQALQLMELDDYDAVLCDVMMPEMTGMELFEEIRRRHPDMARRFVFITGGAFTPEARVFLEREETLCLQKPFSAKALFALLEQVTTVRTPEPALARLRAVGEL